MSPANAYSDRRQIIAFGTPGSKPMIQFTERVSNAHCRLVDRDVDIRIVDIDELRLVDGDANANTELQQLVELRGNSDLPFELLLIGKDGGIKARSVDPEILDAFLAQIDTMPMRRAEIRTAGGADLKC